MRIVIQILTCYYSLIEIVALEAFKLLVVPTVAEVLLIAYAGLCSAAGIGVVDLGCGGIMTDTQSQLLS